MIFQNELSHNHLAINNHNGYEYEQCYLSDGNEGAAIAQSGTKNNIYEHYDKYIVKKALAEFKMKEAQCLGDVKQLLKLGQEYLPYIIKAADLKPTDGYKFIPIVEQGSLMIAEVKLDVNEQGKLDKDNMGRIYVLNNDGTTAPMFMTWVDLNDRNFFDGLNDGLAGESSQLIDGVKEMLEHPIDTVKSLSGLISDIYNDPALLKRISKEKLSEWEDQLKIFETGNDYQRGKANGELIVDVLATFSGVGLDEKLASEVPKMAKLEKIFSADEIVVRPTKVIEGSGKAGNLTRIQVDNLVNDIGGSIKNNPLRREYENAVNDLKSMETKLRSQGISEESIAEHMYQARRNLGVTYKDATPTELRQYIYEVNTKRYGDALGPSFESLVKKYKGNYSKIIEAAQRPNPNVDNLLGGFKEWLLKKNGL